MPAKTFAEVICSITEPVGFENEFLDHTGSPTEVPESLQAGRLNSVVSGPIMSLKVLNTT